MPTPAVRPRCTRHALPTPLSHRLVSILGFVSQTQDPVLGAGLLLMYSLGSTSLVLLAGVLTGASLGTGGALRGLSEWVTPVAGATLLMYATYTGLGVAFPSAA